MYEGFDGTALARIDEALVQYAQYAVWCSVMPLCMVFELCILETGRDWDCINKLTRFCSSLIQIPLFHPNPQRVIPLRHS